LTTFRGGLAEEIFAADAGMARGPANSTTMAVDNMATRNIVSLLA
jgi:hypothetical protein